LPFSYYARLSVRDKEIYRRSDAVTQISLLRPEALWPFVSAVEQALTADRRPEVEAAAQYLARALTTMLEVPPVRLQVLAVRPTLRASELHGLYTRDGRTTPKIQLWMRTAQKRRVVAFRTFLRTLLHELMHHFDYDLLKLPDSFHTEGFFKRESSLFHQLVTDAASKKPAPPF
jgi:hypothetical protein